MPDQGDRIDNLFDYAVDILQSPHPVQRIIDGLERRALKFLGKDEVEYAPQEAGTNS